VPQGLRPNGPRCSECYYDYLYCRRVGVPWNDGAGLRSRIYAREWTLDSVEIVSTGTGLMVRRVA
jgi:hypothetical protein